MSHPQKLQKDKTSVLNMHMLVKKDTVVIIRIASE